MKTIVILTDGKAGHENQSKALVRALGGEGKLVKVAFKSSFAKALSYLFSWLGIRSDVLFYVCPKCLSEVGDLKAIAAVVGTGSGTFYAAAVLARKWGVRCGVVLYPRGYNLKMFDCVIAPAFDRPKVASNVIEVPANLVANDAAFYQAGVESFAARYPVKEGVNAAAVIIGGPNKCSTMTTAWMKAQLDRIFGERDAGQELWVTTSRRTPAEVEGLVDSYDWNYKLLYSKDHYNPIPAFVKLARKLYVTAESTGMLSESCTCGTAEVVALDNLNAGGHKFRRFVESLIAGGYVNGAKKIDLSAQITRAAKLLEL